MATMAMMPSTAHTIISSTRVKPGCFFIAVPPCLPLQRADRDILVIGELAPVQAADRICAQVEQDVVGRAARAAQDTQPGIEHRCRGPGAADVAALVGARGAAGSGAAAELHDGRRAGDADAR